MHSRVVVLAVAALCTASCRDASPPEASTTWKGILQFGTSLDDRPGGVALDALGNVFISGGIASGAERSISEEGFLAKYDAGGNQLWSLRLSGEARGIAVDAGGNAVVVVGRSTPLVEVVKYDPSGGELWLRTTDTTAFWCGRGAASGVATAANGDIVVVGGHTRVVDDNGCVARLDRDGNLLWKSTLGALDGTDDAEVAVALDAPGNAYVLGLTGDFGGPFDVVLARYDDAGHQEWMRPLGTSACAWPAGVAIAKDGAVLVAGSTRGSLGGASGASCDAFLARYDPDGTQVWLRQLGTSDDDFASGLAVDGSGDVLLVGSTRGAFGGPNADGSADAFVAKLDASGSARWVRQLGVTGDDAANDVALDAKGVAFVLGSTSGNLGGSNRGLRDVFVAGYGPDGTLSMGR